MRRAVSVMSCIVSAFTFEESPERARETVDLEIPSSLAISFMVIYFDIVVVFSYYRNDNANLVKRFVFLEGRQL